MRQKQSIFSLFLLSPSSRRAWIEISKMAVLSSCWASVALLAEGVDRNLKCFLYLCLKKRSPSSRRAWIEIETIGMLEAIASVALLAEGADRNRSPISCLFSQQQSPSSRRAWIEIGKPCCTLSYGEVALLAAEGVDRNNGGETRSVTEVRRPPRRGCG